MARVIYAERSYDVADGQTLLDGLLAGGADLPHGCRAGVCGACLVRALDGDVPAGAQVGLQPERRARGYLYACLCRPTADLRLAAPDHADQTRADLLDLAPLSPTVARVRLRLRGELGARAGQYVTLCRDGIARSYSIAGLHPPDVVELHVRRLAGGQLSSYLFERARPGDELTLLGPFGGCTYQPGRADQPLLLVGTGTGLAPLWGILHDALAAGHRGPIHVHHGARARDGLYLVDELRALAAAHAHVRYHPSVLHDDAGAGLEVGALDELLARAHPRTVGMRAFVCGDPALVARLQRQIFLAGAALEDIAADAFLAATPG